MSNRFTHLASVGLWLIALGSTLWALYRLGAGQLATPPIESPGQLGDWLDRMGTAVATFAILRLLAIAVTWYLLIVTAMGVIARAARLDWLVDVADAATVPIVRRLLNGAIGVGFAATSMSVAAVPVAAAVVVDRDGLVHQEIAAGVDFAVGGAPAKVMQFDDQAEAEDVDGADEIATMRKLADGTDVEVDIATSWTIECGDHLWGIAESTLTRAWGRTPTEVEITPYWETLIETNRDQLADPTNPDLVFAGQTFTIPTPPPAS